MVILPLHLCFPLHYEMKTLVLGIIKAFRMEGFYFAASHKPDSVRGYHLSVPLVTRRNQAAYPFRPKRENGPLPTRRYLNLCGISARKVYPHCILPYKAVSSYLTFSPLPTEVDGYFLWHCLFPIKPEPGCSPVRCPRLSGLSSLMSTR